MPVTYWVHLFLLELLQVLGIPIIGNGDSEQAAHRKGCAEAQSAKAAAQTALRKLAASGPAKHEEHLM